MYISKYLTPCAVVFALSFSGIAQADTQTIGEEEFRSHCATCHGLKAKGNGPLLDFLIKKPADLTTLAQRNNGRFPFQHVYNVIDGTQATASHGPRDMPVWGTRYAMDIIREHGFFDADHPETVRARILSLIFYLGVIQE